MTRPIRSSLCARDIPEMHAWLESRLETTMLGTQPEVAARVLELLEDSRTGLDALSSVIRTDPVLSGRVLKLANSAMCAQQREVTDIEQACILLGTERLGHVAIGFLVANETSSISESHSRRVWLTCLSRAFLASELAAKVAPPLARPAFVVGLMVDVGMSLMPALVGEGYHKRYVANTKPDLAFRTELETLPFTHVDVAEILAKRWRLPDVLRKPIAWHHTRPAGRRRQDAESVMHRVAYTVGQLRDPVDCAEADQLAHLGDRFLGITVGGVREAADIASQEFSSVQSMLADVGARLGDMTDLNRVVHAKLVEAHGEVVMRSLMNDLTSESRIFFVGGRRLTVEREPTRKGQTTLVAYLHDDNGDRVASHRFHPTEEDVKAVCKAFAIKPDGQDDIGEFDAFIREAAMASVPTSRVATHPRPLDIQRYAA